MNRFNSHGHSSSLPEALQASTLTQTSEAGVMAFFDGLCAIAETLERGAPAQVSMGITPSLYELIKAFCGADSRFPRVMSNVWVVDRAQLRGHATSSSKS
jgi:hypothetical protein